MKHRSFVRLLLSGFAALAAWGGVFEVAYAAPTIAVRKCSIYPCNSALSLQNEARAASGSLPLGSIVFVSSQQYPLSAFARVCTGPRGGKDACLITSGDLGAVELDNRVYARAAEIEPIDIPAGIAPSATQALPELVEGWILGQVLRTTGRNGWSPWHNIFNPLTWHWMEFYDYRSNTLHKVFSLDRITFRFADGSSVQAEMVGLAAASGHFFRFLPDTIRLPNGEPLVPAARLPAAPSGSGISVTPPWMNAAFAGTMPFNYCSFLHSHCEFVSGGLVLNCYYRQEQFPCG